MSTQIEWIKIPTVNGKQFGNEGEARAYAAALDAEPIVDRFLAEHRTEEELATINKRALSRERNLLVAFETWRILNDEARNAVDSPAEHDEVGRFG